MTAPRWLTALVLVGLLVALYLDWSWPWGVLFIYWAVPAVWTGEAHLIGTIPRETSPVLFWLVTILWVLLGVLMILVDAAPSVVADVYTFLWSL